MASEVKNWSCIVALGIADSFNPRPGSGGGGRLCPPLMFFGDIKKTYHLILTSFSVPDQK